MNIYEIDINGYLWWVAAEDEVGATHVIYDELYMREFSDEEVDEAIDDLNIVEVDPKEAQNTDVVDEYGESMYTLWDLFLRRSEPSLIHTNFGEADEDFFYDERYNEEQDHYWDPYWSWND